MHTARIDNVESVHFGDRERKMVILSSVNEMRKMQIPQLLRAWDKEKRNDVPLQLACDVI